MIDSLVKTFSIIEAGKDVTFSYENKDGIEAFESVSKGDIILGYFAEPIKQIKCVFEVQEIATTTSIVSVGSKCKFVQSLWKTGWIFSKH